MCDRVCVLTCEGVVGMIEHVRTSQNYLLFEQGELALVVQLVGRPLQCVVWAAIAMAAVLVVVVLAVIVPVALASVAVVAVAVVVAVPVAAVVAAAGLAAVDGGAAVTAWLLLQSQ